MRMTRMVWIVATTALVGSASGCRKKSEPAGPPPDSGFIALTGPDGAPRAGPAVQEVIAPGASAEAPMRACRVALRRPDWGPGGELGALSFKLRTVRARGDREQVLAFARSEVCREDGVPPERCTPELFLAEYEWCDGDPRPAASAPSPEVEKMAEKIRAQIPEGEAAAGTADPGGEGEPVPAEAAGEADPAPTAPGEPVLH